MMSVVEYGTRLINVILKGGFLMRFSINWIVLLNVLYICFNLNTGSSVNWIIDQVNEDP